MDVFVIEMLVVLIHSLKMAHKDEKALGEHSTVCTCTNVDSSYIGAIYIGTQDQCVVAIGHMARIIKVKSSVLNKTNKNRRIPKYVDLCLHNMYRSTSLMCMVMYVLQGTECSRSILGGAVVANSVWLSRDCM